MTFDDIKRAIKGHCNLTSPEADTRVGETVNRHHRRITAELGLDSTRFVTRTETTTAGVRTVEFDEIEKIDRILDTTDSSSIRLLREVSVHEQRSTQPNAGQPSTWAPQESGSSTVTVLLDTLPQSTYTLQADGWAALSDLQGNDAPVFPESFHDILTWYGISEELLKKEKLNVAAAFEQKADKLLAELRHFLADSHTRDDRQGRSPISTAGGSGGSGSATLGATAYTQSALVTYDRGAGLAPFAVAQATAAVVTNLDADKLDGEEGTFYLNRANHTGSITILPTEITPLTTDRLLGRDTAGSGAAEQISVTGGIEFSGSTSIRTSAFTGDVTKSAGGTALTIADDAVTDAKLRESAACSVIGRSANTTGNPADIATSTNNTILARISNALSWVAGIVFDGAGAIQQIAFAATQSASSDANTLDDYEEVSWSPADASGAALSLTASGTGIKIGQLVVVQYNITYPATGSGAATLISGLPFTCQNVTGWGGGVSFTDAATTVTGAIVGNSQTFGFKDMSGNNLSNASLSGKIVRGTLMYRATA